MVSIVIDHQDPVSFAFDLKAPAYPAKAFQAMDHCTF
jgi:hypothetical protein